VGSPLLGVVWDRRAAFHQSRLAESFSGYDAVGRQAIASLEAIGLHGPLATAKLTAMASRHAALLGLDDTFQIAGWVFVGLAGFVWLANPLGTKPALNSKQETRETALEELLEEP